MTEIRNTARELALYLATESKKRGLTLAQFLETIAEKEAAYLEGWSEATDDVGRLPNRHSYVERERGGANHAVPVTGCDFIDNMDGTTRPCKLAADHPGPHDVSESAPYPPTAHVGSTFPHPDEWVDDTLANKCNCPPLACPIHGAASGSAGTAHEASLIPDPVDYEALLEAARTIRRKANTMSDETAATDCNVIAFNADIIRGIVERLSVPSNSGVTKRQRSLTHNHGEPDGQYTHTHDGGDEPHHHTDEDSYLHRGNSAYLSQGVDE